MTAVWDKIEQLAETLKLKFSETGTEYAENNTNGWQNYLYSSSAYRRAHVEIVDFRTSHKIYILHCTVFPHYNDPSPIYGFDAVCGPNKITGAFHDFSISGDPTSPMYLWFKAKVHGLEWNKPRELPKWAQMIFSPSMIAAGNLQDYTEIEQLCDTAKTTIDFYLKNVGLNQQDISDYHMAQNRYCYYQKQNPHVINSMVSMGIPKEEMTKFVNEVLFPETSDIYVV
jgi:hypothetical protein